MLQVPRAAYAIVGYAAIAAGRRPNPIAWSLLPSRHLFAADRAYSMTAIGCGADDSIAEAH